MFLEKYQEPFQISQAGTISTLADLLTDHYMSMGYSLVKEDIVEVLKIDFLFYASWAITKGQLTASLPINQDSEISVGEWGIIEPVIRAHINHIQAQRVEASGSMGGERFGLSAAEAEQAYSLTKENMKKDAFVEEPFTVDYEYTKPAFRAF